MPRLQALIAGSSRFVVHTCEHSNARCPYLFIPAVVVENGALIVLCLVPRSPPHL
jgi:hypothetical protein